jgi:hypothetical protein
MYIRNFSSLAAPLNVLVVFCAKGGKFHWEYEHESAFQARWMQELAEFDFELRHVPGKKHVPADFLS